MLLGLAWAYLALAVRSAAGKTLGIPEFHKFVSIVVKMADESLSHALKGLCLTATVTVCQSINTRLQSLQRLAAFSEPVGDMAENVIERVGPVVDMAEQSLSSSSPLSKPYDQFTCFPNLPKELQLMIWQFAASDPRVIEIRGSCTTANEGRHDNTYLVAPKSRIPPPVFHVSSMSRAQAQRFYQKRFLKHEIYGQPEYVWMNNAVDTLLLGETICKKAMERMFVEEQTFNKIAIVIRDQNPNRCQEPARMIEALHGCRSEDSSQTHYLDGCKDLETVLLVLRSDTWDVPDTQVNPDVNFRPTRLHGRTEEATATKIQYGQIIRYFQAGQPLSNVCRHIDWDDRRWSRASNRPSFYFVNFSPFEMTHRIRINVSHAFYNSLRPKITTAFADEFHTRTGCYLGGLYQDEGLAYKLDLYGPDRYLVIKGMTEMTVMMIYIQEAEEERLKAEREVCETCRAETGNLKGRQKWDWFCFSHPMSMGRKYPYL